VFLDGAPVGADTGAKHVVVVHAAHFSAAHSGLTTVPELSALVAGTVVEATIQARDRYGLRVRCCARCS
jgi:hypothetical protein